MFQCTKEQFNTNEIPWKYLNSSLIENIRYHLEIISLAEKFEDIFQYLVLIVFLGDLADLCFIMYHASVVISMNIFFCNFLIEILILGAFI